MQCNQRCVMRCSLSEHVLLWHGTGDLRKNRRKRWLSKTGHLATSMWCLGITKAGKAHNARTRQVPAAAKLCCYGCWGFIHFFSLKGWYVDINEKTRTKSSNPSHSAAKNRNMQNRSKQYLFIHFISFLCLSWESWSFVFSLHLSSWLELKINRNTFSLDSSPCHIAAISCHLACRKCRKRCGVHCSWGCQLFQLNL